MTAISAMRSGAGLVTLGIAQSLNAILESLVLEAMTEPLPEMKNGRLGESAFEAVMNLVSGKQCLAIGPGLGQCRQTKSLVRRIIQESPVPLVIDADGLNNLAGQTQILKKLTRPVILTPHPGEMARLVGRSVPEIQRQRVEEAVRLGEESGAVVVLLGGGRPLYECCGRQARPNPLVVRQ